MTIFGFWHITFAFIFSTYLQDKELKIFIELLSKASWGYYFDIKKVAMRNYYLQAGYIVLIIVSKKTSVIFTSLLWLASLLTLVHNSEEEVETRDYKIFYRDMWHYYSKNNHNCLLRREIYFVATTVSWKEIDNNT